jgi:hypothetical protein
LPADSRAALDSFFRARSNSPKRICFPELTEDGAKAGVTFENTSETEPLVTLRYFGPEVNPDAPKMGAYRRNRFH